MDKLRTNNLLILVCDLSLASLGRLEVLTRSCDVDTTTAVHPTIANKPAMQSDLVSSAIHAGLNGIVTGLHIDLRDVRTGAESAEVVTYLSSRENSERVH